MMRNEFCWFLIFLIKLSEGYFIFQSHDCSFAIKHFYVTQIWDQYLNCLGNRDYGVVNYWIKTI